jgi:hypothetical protein
MAKEPRLSRRALSAMMAETIKNFPENAKGLVSNQSLMPSVFPGVGYVFLELFHDKPGDFDSEYRPRRLRFLEIACGAAKLKWPHLAKIVGTGMDAPKYSSMNAEDFILLDCENWPEEAGPTTRRRIRNCTLFRRAR